MRFAACLHWGEPACYSDSRFGYQQNGRDDSQVGDDPIEGCLADAVDHQYPEDTADHDGRIWVEWEHGGASWGKDWGAYDREDGVGLYKGRQIGIRVWESGQWKRPSATLAGALPKVPSAAGWINIQFKPGITALVGPNGCGKKCIGLRCTAAAARQ